MTALGGRDVERTFSRLGEIGLDFRAKTRMRPPARNALQFRQCDRTGVPASSQSRTSEKLIYAGYSALAT